MAIPLNRRVFVRILAISVIAVASALSIEYVLEARDFARLMPGQTFAQVGDTRIRYRLLGVKNRGATVVFLSGLAGCIEQTETLQIRLSADVPTLAYDRAGYCFSRGSHAHNAEEQAAELAGLLRVLKIEKPIVLASYSISTETARVFAARHPEKIASLYLIDPWMPELQLLMPKEYAALYYSGRPALQSLIQASLGFIRLSHRLHNWQGPKSLTDQITEAANVGRQLRWAILAEWYVSPKTLRQTLQATIPPTVPIEVAYTKQQFPMEEASKTVAKMYADLVAHSSRGTLVEFEHVNHEHLMDPSDMLEPMIARIRQLSKESAPETP